MKKLLLAPFLIWGICSFKTSSYNEDLKALAAENKVLTKKTDSLYNSLGAVNMRIDKVNKLVGQKNQTAANLLPVFQKECEFISTFLDKALALKKSLDDQIVIIRQTDKEINKDMGTTDTERAQLMNELDRIGKENSASYDKIKEVVKIFSGHKKSVCKTLVRLEKEAKE